MGAYFFHLIKGFYEFVGSIGQNEQVNKIALAFGLAYIYLNSKFINLVK
jgi:hypothetical protein